MEPVLKAARDSLALSIYSIPIKPGAKRPALGSDWQKARIELDDLEKHFGNGENIGWLLGINPRPIADVDLDCPEALAVAQFIKGPKTERIAGRKSNPSSHYFFELPGEFEQTTFPDPFRKGKDERKMLIELRGKGNQTVVPPSIHESGEPYQWYKKGEFGKATHHDVLRWTAKIAAAALLMRYWTARVSGRLGLIGMLCRAEWPEEETLEFVSAVIRFADPDDLKEVKANVANCYHRVDGDGEAFGRPKLLEVLGDKGKQIIKTITDWLGLNRAMSQDMLCTKEGAPRPILANAITALKRKEWEGVLALNEFSLHVEVRGKETPWGKPPGEKWTDVDDIRTANWLQHQYVSVNPQTAHDAVQIIADENRFHPVKEYLKSQKWDEVVRLDTWLISYLGVKDSAFARAIGKRWLISAVARIFEPGCQADHTLLLEGPQGIKKSTALRTLAGAEWFTDHISDLDSKDSRMELHGVWIVELAELSTIRRSLTEKVKSFLTATADHFRPPYGRSTIIVPRQNVFAGSINDETPFTDETGNRRFWPVRCGRIDIDKLAEHRDQLWAEALAAYESEEHWWIDSEELNAIAKEEQKLRYQSGVWDEKIKAWLENPTQRYEYKDGQKFYVTPWDGSTNEEVTSDDILLHAIGKPVDRWAQSDKIAISKCLTSNGWQRMIVKDVCGKSQRVFRKRES
jgi:hypothetical protein